MQANALAVLGLAKATLEEHEHGTAGVDDIRGHGRIGCQQAGEKAPIPVSQ
jgi:hypothetical protein